MTKDQAAAFVRLQQQMQVEAEIAQRMALLVTEDRPIERRILSGTATPTDFARARSLQDEIAKLDERRERMRRYWSSARAA